MWQGTEYRKKGLHTDDFPFDSVILNLGLIQEYRLKGIGKFDYTTLQRFDSSGGMNEHNLRAFRNRVNHPTWDGGGGISKADALGCLKFTINKLLRMEYFDQCM
jgi:hypothetical protein